MRSSVRSGAVVGGLAMLLSLVLLGTIDPVPARAEDPPATEPAAPPEPAPVLAVIQGTNVNVRVGPRVDVVPVMQLNDGDVVLIVERVPGWLGVRIPRGFKAAAAAKYLEPLRTHAVRVAAHKLNLRVQPPQEGGTMPGAFRDHPDFGAALTLIERVGEWAIVVAPETTRAYVSDRYVREVGPVTEHADLLQAARVKRMAWVHRIVEERLAAEALRSGRTLRTAIGTAQQTLYRLRIEAGLDRAPVVDAANVLEAAIEASRAAPAPVRKLALALRQDLESELEIRMARKDAEVARLRGLEPPPERAPAPVVPKVVLRGQIRWEPAPTWRNGGAFVLWVGGEPTHVVRLTTGMPLPHPDLKGAAGAGERTVRGRQPGERVFGLPVVEVESLEP